MQQNGLLVRPLDPGEVVTMLKENPRMSKKQIGEFISNKKNTKIMEAFQKSVYILKFLCTNFMMCWSD